MSGSPDRDLLRLNEAFYLRLEAFPQALSLYLLQAASMVKDPQSFTHLLTEAQQNALNRRRAEHFVKTVTTICPTIFGVDQDTLPILSKLAESTIAAVIDPNRSTNGMNQQLLQQALEKSAKPEALEIAVGNLRSLSGDATITIWRDALKIFMQRPDLFGAGQ